MIKSIVVPLDGSRLAEAAIPTARWLARAAHSRLRFLHVRPKTPTPAAPVEYLDTAAAMAGSGGGCTVDYRIEEGPVAATMKSAIDSDHADLIVMATRGRGDPGPLGRASLAEQLAAGSSAPLLLVKPCPGTEIPCRPVNLDRLIAAVEPQADLATLVESLTDFVTLNQAHVTLLTVVPPTPFEPRLTANRCQQALAKLDSIADQFRAHGARVAARAVAGDDVAATILAEAVRARADAIVLRPRGNLTGSPLPGRTTDAVIRGATVPVLVLPPLATSD